MSSRPTRPYNFPGYKDEEWAEITAAVEAEGYVVPEGWKLTILLCSVPQLRFTPDGARELAAEYKKIADAVLRLDELLFPRIEQGMQSEGLWERDHIGEEYEKCRPILDRIYGSAACRSAYFAKQEREQRADPERKQNAEKIFQNDIWRRVGGAWQSIGGVVNYSKSYKRFFEAVCHPVYVSKFGHDVMGLQWSDNTFNDHVKLWRRLHQS